MDPWTARTLRELPPPKFQDLVLYASDRSWTIVETYNRVMRDLPPSVVDSFAAAFEGELFSATFLIGLASLYHLGPKNPPTIMQKLINIHSFGQLRDPYSIAELVAAERGNANALPRCEGDWWWQYGGPLNQIVPPPAMSTRKILEGWLEHRRVAREERPRPDPPLPDALRLLHLSRDDLHLASQMSDKLRQEAAMESISTLRFIQDVDRSVQKLDEVLDALDFLESSGGVALPESMDR